MYLGSSHKSLQRSADKILSDCLEAIIGAIFLDSGLRNIEQFILHFWKKFLEDSSVTLIDAKTQLQEHSLKIYKELPKYYDIVLKNITNYCNLHNHTLFIFDHYNDKNKIRRFIFIF